MAPIVSDLFFGGLIPAVRISAPTAGRAAPQAIPGSERTGRQRSADDDDHPADHHRQVHRLGEKEPPQRTPNTGIRNVTDSAADALTWAIRRKKRT